MIPYKDYQLSERQIMAVVNNNAKRRINDYIKEHGVEPSDSVLSGFYTISEDELERHRRIYYAITMGEMNGAIEPTIPSADTGTTIDSGITVDSGSTEDSGNTIDSGSTIESGSTIDSGSTEESGTTRPSSQFVLSLAEIPCAVGDGDWSRYAIDTIRVGIMNGDLLDYTSAEITMSGNNGSVITITDLTKSYYIPDGEYVAEGWIGRNGSRGFHDWGWPQYEKGFALAYGQFVIDGSKKTIPLTIEINDALIISDIEFRGKTGGSPKASYEYNNNYYFFVRNDYHSMGLSTPYISSAIPMTFLFDGIEYKIDSFNMGAAYCYGWNNEIPQNYTQYEYVDLGLPSGTLWAKCNVGADNEWVFGDYFAWGETSKKETYTWDNYKFGHDENSVSKYNDANDNLLQLESEDDTASVNMGGNWHVPTKSQIEELVRNTHQEWTTINEVSGIMYTSVTDPTKYVFFPAAGLKGSSFSKINEEVHLWSSTPIREGGLSRDAYHFFSHHIDVPYSGIQTIYNRSLNRVVGCPVRGVIDNNYNSGSTQSFDYDEFVRLTYNVTDIYNPTKLFYSSASTEGIGYMEIDGVSVQPTDSYEFKTLGTHKVDVLLKDSSKMAPLRFTNVPSLREVIIPSSVDSLQNAVFNNCTGIEKITCLNILAPSVETKKGTGYGEDMIYSAADFYNINQNGKLYVPYGSIPSYSADYSWVGLLSSQAGVKNLATYHWEIEELPQSED